jgi:hypothetical protein
VAASLPFRSVSSSFFFRSAASLCASHAMASLTRWTFCAALIWACSFASQAAAASACALAASCSRSVRSCACSARDYINKQAK